MDEASMCSETARIADTVERAVTSSKVTLRNGMRVVSIQTPCSIAESAALNAVAVGVLSTRSTSWLLMIERHTLRITSAPAVSAGSERRARATRGQQWCNGGSTLGRRSRD